MNEERRIDLGLVAYGLIKRKIDSGIKQEDLGAYVMGLVDFQKELVEIMKIPAPGPIPMEPPIEHMDEDNVEEVIPNGR